MSNEKTGTELTTAGARLNAAFAALQDADDNVSARTRGELDREFYDAVQFLVKRIVRKFRPSSQALYEEYLQAGMVGAVEALNVWDRRRGSASTVVMRAVNKHLHAAVRRSEFGGMSRYDFIVRGQVTKALRKADAEGEHLTAEDLAEKLEIPEVAVKRILEFNKPSSLDATLSDDGVTSYADMVVGEDDVVRTSWTANEDRLLLLKALGMVGTEKPDLIGDFVVIRSLGLDGEAPSTFPQIKRMLGRTNVESLRLRAKRRQSLMVSAIADDPARFGLTAEDVVTMAHADDNAESDAQIVAVTEQARAMLGDDTEENVAILAEMLLDAYTEQELIRLTGARKGLMDAPEARSVCNTCGTPNDPNRVKVFGCTACGEVPGRAPRLELEPKDGNALFDLKKSKAWRRKHRGRAKTRTTSASTSDAYDTMQLFY